MLRWGFLEILFLRSRLNGGICLLPTLAFPPWDEGGEGGTLEVRGLARDIPSDLCIAFLSTGSAFHNIPPEAGCGNLRTASLLRNLSQVAVVEAGL